MQCREPAISNPVVVIGAGMGGLAAAIDLASSGFAVHVIDKAPAAGGKLRQIHVDGRGIDSGPTVMTMRWVLDGLLEDAGAPPENRVGMQLAQRLARHSWASGASLDLYADLEASADAIGHFSGAADARAFLRFSADARRIYRSLEPTFINAHRTSMLGLCARFGLTGFKNLARLKPYTSLWRVLGLYFRDPRLKQLFGRYAGYCGSSPFLSPATLMLVAHAEREGLWLVDQGMGRIVEALRAELERLGGKLTTNTAASRILSSKSQVTGVEIDNGEVLPASAVVCNADVSAIGMGLLGRDVQAAAPPVASRDRSMSAMTWSLLASVEGPAPIRHNVFFSDDYQREFSEIFSEKSVPRAPTVYVCAQDRDDDGRLSAGERERLLVIVNAPADGDTRIRSAAEVEQCRAETFTHLAACGMTLDYRPTEIRATTPADFERLFPGSGGGLYGRASHGWRSSFQRAGGRTKVPGLYLAGGSAHPGPGVPMAMLSGRLAAACIREDFASTKP